MQAQKKDQPLTYMAEEEREGGGGAFFYLSPVPRYEDQGKKLRLQAAEKRGRDS